VNEVSGAWFIAERDGLVPHPAACSPWSAEMLHGRLLAGLAARAVEAEDHDPELRVVRLTVDMFRSPPMAPLDVSTRVVRDGRRVRVVDASIGAGGVELARGRSLMLRTGPHPRGAVWGTPEWNVPEPDALAPPEPVAEAGWEIRLISAGGFWTTGHKQLWSRDRWQLVQGEEPSPVVRAALAADLPNPLANSGAEGLQFINADLSLFLVRPPGSEWIGVEVQSHVGADGIAIGTCTLHDTAGPIGSSSVCALASQTALAV
jgi:hypothetical protein